MQGLADRERQECGECGDVKCIRQSCLLEQIWMAHQSSQSLTNIVRHIKRVRENSDELLTRMAHQSRHHQCKVYLADSVRYVEHVRQSCVLEQMHAA